MKSLREMAMKATHGKWKLTKPSKSYMNGELMYGVDGPTHVGDYEDWGFAKQDAAYIAAVSPDVVLHILDRCDKLGLENDALQKENAKLRKLNDVVPQPVAVQWQPIETAPKETLVFIGAYVDGVWKFGKAEMFYEQANEFEGETFSGWVWSEDEICMQEPTHWMPLPAPPAQGEKV